MPQLVLNIWAVLAKLEKEAAKASYEADKEQHCRPNKQPKHFPAIRDPFITRQDLDQPRFHKLP